MTVRGVMGDGLTALASENELWLENGEEKKELGDGHTMSGIEPAVVLNERSEVAVLSKGLKWSKIDLE